MIHQSRIYASETPGADEPVTVADVKTWANIDYADDDDLLESMITGARQDIENITNLKLVPNTVEIHANSSTGEEMIDLPYGTPANIVVSSSYRGTPTVLTTDYYYVSQDSVYVFNDGDHKITYSVGASPIPEALKEAVKMLVAYRYENRGDREGQPGLPEDVRAKVAAYRKIYV